MAGRLLLGALLRAAVVVAVLAGYLVVLDNSDSTDALGAGLLAFLIMVAIAFVWALVDGVRTGFVASLVRWLIASVLVGVGVPLVVAIRDDDGLALVGEDVLFFSVLLFVPAAIGLAIGAVVYRVRGVGEADAAG